MVRDNPDRRVTQSRKQNPATETQNQSQPQGEPAEPEGAEPEGIQPENQEPTESQLDLLQWRKLKLHEEPDTWCQVSTQRQRQQQRQQQQRQQRPESNSGILLSYVLHSIVEEVLIYIYIYIYIISIYIYRYNVN